MSSAELAGWYHDPMRSVYLDNNATTAVTPEVVEAMTPFFLGTFGNASSVHTPGQKARSCVESARECVAGCLGAEPEEIVFTSGGTESDNLAILGAVRANGKPGRHLITTSVEHPAVLRAFEQLESEGYRVTYLTPNGEGVVSADDFENAVCEDTILASVMYVNNETGSIQPLESIARIASQKQVILHTDAVQAVGKIRVDLRALRVDLLSLSAHKIHGPKGVGALFVRRGTPLKSLQLGGSHEKGRRGGTENVPGIVGLGKALQLGMDYLGEFDRNIGTLRDRLEAGFLAAFPECSVNGGGAPRASHVSNLSFRGLQGESLLIALDFAGISVSTGAACTSGRVSPSHVLVAMGLPKDRIQGALRFSLGRLNCCEDVDYTLEVGVKAIERIKGALVSKK